MILFFFEFFFIIFLCFVVLSQQPLTLAGFLLLISFIVRCYISFLYSSWYSFSLFLIYIGGILVLFGYVIVLVPNFIFSFKRFFFFLIYLYLYFYTYRNGEIFNFFFDFSFFFFDFSNFFIYLGLAIILFIGLIRVVKICFFQIGALRPFYFIFYV